MFLSKEELKTVTTIEIIDLITNKDDDTVEQIIKECISVFKTYLGSYYDMDTVFAQTGDNRNLTILKYLKAVVAHEIPKRRKKPVSKQADADYNEAMNWLEKIASGEWRADLPRKKDEKTGEEKPFMKIGSHKSYQNGW
ncbi:hypothetical protein CMT52_07790 [Elizabethkingia anophelis]|nr:hypothetical protein [Elizabethkingia anophelis]